MSTELFWIEGPWRGRLAISARPRGGEWLNDEMRAWRAAGIDAVVSLLEPHEVADLGLENEGSLCEANGMEFFSLPIVDRNVPQSGPEVQQLLAQLDRELQSGKRVTIHCRQGVGRAGLIAVALLVEKGFTPDPAIERVSSARHVRVPETSQQRAWIDSFSAALSRKAF